MIRSSYISQLPVSWSLLLSPVINTPDFQILLSKLASSNKIIHPPVKETFTAYQLSEVNNIKVVIIGQDPYHGFQQAHGLSFSVKKGNPHPPSLRNIFQELKSDLGIAPPPKTMGELTQWAQQGVFLLNAVLTVEDHQANSHQNLGWEEFTDATIQTISEKNSHVVFVLWGGYAQKKAVLIDESKHLILQSAHPSPLSAYRGFWGSKPFSKINSYLINTNQLPINWEITDI